MITIIHGEDIVTSRKLFLELLHKNQDSTLLNGETLEQSELAQHLQGSMLFGDTQKLFIENFLSQKKQSKDLPLLVSYLLENQQNKDITIWEGRELTQKQLALIPKATIKKYAFPQSLFVFLDSLKPGNALCAIKLFHEALQTTAAELLLFMVVRHIRLLLALSQRETSIDELKRMSPWQKSKLEKQSRLFTQDKLLRLYSSLYTLDTSTKTGTSGMPLQTTIDFLLSDL